MNTENSKTSHFIFVGEEKVNITVHNTIMLPCTTNTAFQPSSVNSIGTCTPHASDLFPTIPSIFFSYIRRSDQGLIQGGGWIGSPMGFNRRREQHNKMSLAFALSSRRGHIPLPHSPSRHVIQLTPLSHPCSTISGSATGLYLYTHCTVLLLLPDCRVAICS